MEISLYLAGLLALLITLLVGIVLQPLANKLDIVAHPNERTVHTGNIPLVGGLAIFTGFCTAVIFVDPAFFGYQAFFLASIILIIVGILDDRNHLSVRARFMFQIVAVLIVAFWGDISLNNLGDILFIGELNLGLFAVPIMVFSVLGVINALNMADGIDGLASGYTVIALSGLLYLAWGCENCASEQALLLLLVAAVLGFMLLNTRSPWCRKAKVFMGDSGSMFLGFTLAVAFIQLSQGDSKIMAPVTALWLFALPLMDTVSLIMRRKSQGRSPFAPAKDHIHHILQRAGYKVAQISMLGWGASAVLALIGIIGYRLGVHDGIMFSGFMTLFFFYHWMVSRALKDNRIFAQPLKPQLEIPPVSVEHPAIEYMFKPGQQIASADNGIMLNDYRMTNPSYPSIKANEHETRISVSERSLIKDGNLPAHESNATNILAHVNEHDYFDSDYILFMSDSGDFYYYPIFTTLNQKIHPTETGIPASHEGLLGSLPAHMPSFGEANNQAAGDKEINSFKFASNNALNGQFVYVKNGRADFSAMQSPEMSDGKTGEHKYEYFLINNKAIKNTFDFAEKKSTLSGDAIFLPKYYRNKIDINNTSK